MKSENKRLAYEQLSMKEKIKENKDKIKLNKQLPYLVGNVVEVGQGRRTKARSDHEKRTLSMTCVFCIRASFYFIH